ncbi:MAG: hypothetical protein ACP5HD_00895 [Thermoproteus sp.]
MDYQKTVAALKDLGMERWSREERRRRLARGAPEASMCLELTCATLGIPQRKT